MVLVVVRRVVAIYLPFLLERSTTVVRGLRLAVDFVT
jgi:hypothetical protein